MSTLAIDTYRLLTALKGTGKGANFTAEEIANAIHAAQEEIQLLTKPEFEDRMAALEARFDAKLDRLEARFDAKLEAIRADIKASQIQTLLWLSGRIVLVSNGATVALLGRLAHVY